MPLPTFDADFVIETPAGTATVRGDEDQLVVDAPDVATAEALVRGMFALPGGVRGAHQVLRESGIGLQLTVASRLLARLGEGADPGVIQRLARIPGEVRLGNVLRTLLARPKG